MFTRIVVPVDLTHADKLKKALAVAADLARHHDIPVVYLGVTGTLPDAVAPTPEAFGEKLAAFAAAEAEAHGIAASAHPVVDPDPAAALSRVVRRAVEDLGADLVVMASHAPSAMDWLIPSQGGSVAEHSGASVFIVR